MGYNTNSWGDHEYGILGTISVAIRDPQLGRVKSPKFRRMGDVVLLDGKPEGFYKPDGW